MSGKKNQREKQAEIEQYYFEAFRKLYPLPEGCVAYGDKPDIVIDGAKRIGIEITNLYIDDGTLIESEQRQCKIRDKVIKKAQEAYLKRNNNPIEMAFGFDSDKLIIDIDILATKIADMCCHLGMTENGVVSRECYRGIPELSFAYFLATTHDAPKWRPLQVYTGRLMSKERLVQIIEGKDKKDYSKCDTCWLLVVVDFINPAQDQEIMIDGLDEIKSSKFDKIILYRHGLGQIKEIDVLKDAMDRRG